MENNNQSPSNNNQPITKHLFDYWLFSIGTCLVFVFCILVIPLVYAQHEGHQMQQEQKQQYRCPMHPQVVSDKPGKCPICGMNLAEAQEAKMPAAAVVEQPVLKIKESQQELIGIASETVIYRDLLRKIRTVAKIAFDPELYKAEEEFIQAHKAAEKLSLNASPETRARFETLEEASVFKLKLLGLNREQIEDLKTKAVSDRGLLISELSSAWAYLTIYEYDFGSVKIGDHVVLKAIAYPGEEFSGNIVALDPVLDMDTRSVRARVQVDNPENKLKPNMYADAFIHIDLGPKLAVPREAVLDTGLRKIVYLNLGSGQFRAQEIEAGEEAVALADKEERKFFPVIKGLKENDLVVTNGNFLIDSQSQLTGGMSALWGASTEIKEEHRH